MTAAQADTKILPPPGRPTITVATVVYNGAQDIARTIDSTLAQDYPLVEYVVVDGNSTDGTQAIVAGYGKAIDIFISEPDQGIYDGMNKAIALASGEFIIFMNCGDTFARPDALSTLVNCIRPEIEQVLFGCWIRRDSRRQAAECRPSLKDGVFNHQSVLYSRSLHENHGKYASAPGFTAADYLFFITVLANGNVPCTAVDTTVAVIDTGGISAGPQTLSQKLAIDYLYGRASRLKLAAVLMLHPLYRRIKTALRN